MICPLKYNKLIQKVIFLLQMLKNHNIRTTLICTNFLQITLSRAFLQPVSHGGNGGKFYLQKIRQDPSRFPLSSNVLSNIFLPRQNLIQPFSLPICTQLVPSPMVIQVGQATLRVGIYLGILTFLLTNMNKCGNNSRCLAIKLKRIYSSIYFHAMASRM